MQDKNIKVPLSARRGPLSSFHIEVDKSQKGFSLLCSGVKGINEFSETNILLRLNGFSLSVFGTKLFIKVYEEKTVEVIGRFSEVRFIYAKS